MQKIITPLGANSELTHALIEYARFKKKRKVKLVDMLNDDSFSPTGEKQFSIAKNDKKIRKQIVL